ncbi:MAG: tetratricopeptide repeat protein [Caldilineaceae bacterium]|jgi:predicted ATPase/class 3 adenylate cyclase
MQESLLAYIPMDRRHAMAAGRELPDRTRGAALFADISGFTQLTEALLRELGALRGAEELTRYLNLVYDALIDKLHTWGGSAISFAGDAVTCWFDGDTGLHAAACALHMQQAMDAFTDVRTPFGSSVTLTMSASVAAGSARRLLVGDPSIRVIDAIAGATIERLDSAEKLAGRGEVLLDRNALEALRDQVTVAETRTDELNRPFGLLTALRTEPQPPGWPELDTDRMTEAQVRPWLLAPVYDRLSSGMGDFLAEIRPTVAVFLRFSGIDYDNDEAAGDKLDLFVRRVQAIVERYRGTLVDLNMGDKGSYLYINFGAPIANEDNAARAASTALELRALPDELRFIRPLQIGVTQGRMRAGAYGGSMHRTYGVLGDAVNLAARLMMKCEPDQIIFSKQVQTSIRDQFSWEPLPPALVKGKSEPVEIVELCNTGSRPAMHLPQHTQLSPLIGRQSEVGYLVDGMEAALSGHGQILALVGEAGLGKSRLVAEAIHRALERGFSVFGGECESYGVNTSYLVWQPIWRALLGIEADWPEERQIAALRSRIGAIDRMLTRRLPLVGPLLGLAIPDNDLTNSFDAKLRKSSLETLLTDILTAIAGDLPVLIVIEDAHWLDSLSHDLLEVLGRSIADLPVVILLSFRAMELERLKEERVSTLPYYSEITLSPLGAGELSDMARRRLSDLTTADTDAISEQLVQRLAQQAEGNPFYLEELVNFIGNRALDPSDPYALVQLELPSSVQSLVLSRLDQLEERQKTLLKVASVVGRVFRVLWLTGAYPDLGLPENIRDNLTLLSQQNLTVQDQAEPELTYFFKHVITHSVIYDSLLHMLRTSLHEQIGNFIEATYADTLDQHLDLLAYHFDRSEVLEKRIYYLRRAGEAAQAAYANDAAIDYYERVIPLLSIEHQVSIKRKLGEVLQLVGRWDEAEKLYHEAAMLAQETDQRAEEARSETAIGELLRLQGHYTTAWEQFEHARQEFDQIGDQEGVALTLHLSGNVAVQQGDYTTARSRFNESLAIRRETGDQTGTARLLNNLAIVAEFESDFDTAYALHQEALAIRRAVNDRAWIGYSLNNLANVIAERGDLSAARAYLEEAVEIQREIGDRWGLANALGNLGNVVRSQEDFDEAKRLYNESLIVNRGLGDRWAIAELLEYIAGLCVLRGAYARGVNLLGAAEHLRDEIGAALPPNDQEKLDRLFAPAYAALGDEYDAVKAKGSAQSLDEAINFALE